MQIIRDKNTKVVIRMSPTAIRADGKIPTDLDPSLELVDVMDMPAKPVFNPATHEVVSISSEQPGAPGFPLRLIYDWQVVALTQAERDIKAADAADEAERQQLRALVGELKNPGAKTTAQRLITVERVLARIIPDIYR